VIIENAWGSSLTLGNGRDTMALVFTKGPNAVHLTPANRTNFTTITLDWVPATAPTVTTSTVNPTAYCTGTAVSVPFTKGTGTFYNNNIWTAQLSDASGSFASPVSIGTLAGTSAGTINATIPAGAADGTAYRIRVVSSQPESIGSDNGADLTISNCTGIDENSNNSNMEILPNPSNGIVYLTAGSLTGDVATIEVYDAKGQKVYSEQSDTKKLNNKAIDLTAFPKGIYVMNVSDGNSTYSEKVVIK
jgi:hypothetical protein